MTVEIQIAENAWPKSISEQIRAVDNFLRKHFDLFEGCELSVLLTHDEEIRALNREFRNKDSATNVLSWPAEEISRELGKWPDFEILTQNSPFVDLGDLAFAYETCLAESEGIGFNNHFTHLFIHGYLHLLGFDHIDDKDAKLMEALEIELLSRLNISNPYERG